MALVMESSPWNRHKGCVARSKGHHKRVDRGIDNFGSSGPVHRVETYGDTVRVGLDNLLT